MAFEPVEAIPAAALSERTPHNGNRNKMPFHERMSMSVQLRRMAMTFASNTSVPSAFPARVPAGSYCRNWGEDRVWFQDKLGRLHSLPTSWTDAGAVDPFVALAAGRSLFRVADLIELARQIDGWKSERVERTVKENMSCL